MHEKNIFYYIFGLSEVDAWKEYLIFSSPFKRNTCMKKKLRAMILFEWITFMKRIFYSFLSLLVNYMQVKKIKDYDNVWKNDMPERLFYFLFLDWVNHMQEKNIL